MTPTNPVRVILVVAMNVAFALAIALAIRLGVAFFGGISSSWVGELVIHLTDPLVLPFGIEAIKTPYGGVFDVDAALTIGVLLIAEWLLALVPSRTY